MISGYQDPDVGNKVNWFSIDTIVQNWRSLSGTSWTKSNYKVRKETIPNVWDFWNQCNFLENLDYGNLMQAIKTRSRQKNNLESTESFQMIPRRKKELSVYGEQRASTPKQFNTNYAFWDEPKMEITKQSIPASYFKWRYIWWPGETRRAEKRYQKAETLIYLLQELIFQESSK